jgi:hypothetical protein
MTRFHLLWGRRATRRMLGTLVLLAVLIWLAVDRVPTKRRWLAIAAEFKRGTIGHGLPPEQDKLLRQTVQWLLPYADIRGPVRINEPPLPGSGLHIFTTTAAAFGATGCATGNAVYDADLDAIFIDQDLFAQADLENLGEDSPTSLIGLRDLVFLPVYLRFVLMHELGHRSLHGTSGGLFDFHQGSREMEQEADDFALESLVEAYKEDIEQGGHQIGPGAAEVVQMDGVDLEPAERVWVDLVATASAMSWTLMYSSSDYSSFYSDSAHPTFITRAMTIFKKARTTGSAGSMLKAHAALHYAILTRMREFASGRFVEIQLPYGVQRVAFGEAELAVLTNGGYVFMAPNRLWRDCSLCPFRARSPLEFISQFWKKLPVPPTADSRPDLGSVRLTQPALAGPQAGQEDVAWASNIWGSSPRGFMKVTPDFTNGRELTVEGLQPTSSQVVVRKKPAVARDVSQINSLPALFVPPQPADVALLTSSIPDSGDTLAIVHAESPSSTMAWGELEQAVLAETGLKAINLEIGTVSSNTAYLSIRYNLGSRSRFFGIAELDLQSHVLTVVPLRFEHEGGHEAPGLYSDRIVAAPTGQRVRYLLVTRNRGHMLLYELSTHETMKLVAQHPFILDGVKLDGVRSDSLDVFATDLYAAYWVPPHFIVSAYKPDSVYSTNLLTGDTRVLFTPGFPRVEMTLGRAGYIAIFVSNGHKVYVVKAYE